jgi:pyruvate dehydrogenase E1 component alpha subunit
MDIPRETLLEMYRKVLICRKLDDLVYELNTTGAFTGWIHLAAGQEALPVAIGAILQKDDYIKMSSRGYHTFIGRGVPLKPWLAMLLGRIQETPINTRDYGFLGGSITLGEEMPIYTGAAWSAKMERKGRVVACIFGDGTANRAPVHESMNLAAIWKLPIVFFCENNGFAISMPTEKAFAISDIADRAAAYGMPGVVVDGNDVIACYEVVHDAIKMAREGGGPSLIEAKTYRLRGHFEGDPQQYRTKEEVEEKRKGEPIGRYREALLKMDILAEKDAERIEKETTTEVEEALEYAQSLPKRELPAG